MLHRYTNQFLDYCRLAHLQVSQIYQGQKTLLIFVQNLPYFL